MTAKPIKPPASIDDTLKLLASADYLADRSLATVLFLALRMGRPDEAQRRVELAFENGVVTGTLCLILALSCRSLRNAAGEEAALDRVVAPAC